MRRLVLLVASLLGSVVGAGFGIAAGIGANSALLACASAAVFPIVALVLAGFRNRIQIAKIAAYALIGWGLCFFLAPATSQTDSGRAKRIAADPLVGKGWYIPCHIASWVMVTIGVTFVRDEHLIYRSN